MDAKKVKLHDEGRDRRRKNQLRRTEGRIKHIPLLSLMENRKSAEVKAKPHAIWNDEKPARTELPGRKRRKNHLELIKIRKRYRGASHGQLKSVVRYLHKGGKIKSQ